MEDETQNGRRGVFAGFGAIAALTGAALLYFGALPMGIVMLTLGCIGLGWAIGGYGGSGYGGSDS